MKRKGFSTVELVIGIGILSMSIVFLIAMYMSMFRASQKGIDLTSGTAVAQQVMEEFVQKNNDTLALSDDLGGKMETEAGTRTIGPTTFSYAVYISEKNSNVDSSVAYDFPVGGVRKIDVEVSWWGDDTALTGERDKKKTRANYGLMSAKVSRIIYFD